MSPLLLAIVCGFWDRLSVDMTDRKLHRHHPVAMYLSRGSAWALSYVVYVTYPAPGLRKMVHGGGYRTDD